MRQTEQEYIYAYIPTHVIAMNEKEAMDWKEQGAVYGRDWKEGKGWENDVITVPCCVCGDQRTNYRTGFCLSTMQAPGIKLTLASFGSEPLFTHPFHQPMACSYLNMHKYFL